MMTGEELAPLFTHGGWSSSGTKIEGNDLDYLLAGGRAGITRYAGTAGNNMTAVKWSNALQAACEANGGYGIPATVSTDSTNILTTIDMLGIGATMDTDFTFEIGKANGEQYRAVGITMLFGPQIDITTTPIWSRASGTYSEDPALSRDLARAYIDGL